MLLLVSSICTNYPGRLGIESLDLQTPRTYTCTLQGTTRADSRGCKTKVWGRTSANSFLLRIHRGHDSNRLRKNHA